MWYRRLGSPFDSVAPLPKQYGPQRLSAPQQSPQLTAQKYQSNRQQQVQPKQRAPTQPQPRYNQARPISTPQAAPSAYRAPSTANAYSYTRAQPQTRQAAPALVTKHFYIHAAPEEPEEKINQRYVQLGTPRKNYKS